MLVRRQMPFSKHSSAKAAEYSDPPSQDISLIYGRLYKIFLRALAVDVVFGSQSSGDVRMLLFHRGNA